MRWSPAFNIIRDINRSIASKHQCHRLLKRSNLRHKYHFFSNISPSQQRPTLFSLPNLSQPQDFLTLSRIAIESCDNIRKSLAASLQSPPAETTLEESILQAKRTLHQLDDISNEVCTVIDACELCRSVHASPEWRRAAGDAFGHLSEYIGALNADESELRKKCFNLYYCFGC